MNEKVAEDIIDIIQMIHDLRHKVNWQYGQLSKEKGRRRKLQTEVERLKEQLRVLKNE